MQISAAARSLAALLSLFALVAAGTASTAQAYGDEPDTSTIRIRLKGPTLRIRCRGGDCTITAQREGTLYHVSVTRSRFGGVPFTFQRTVDNPKNIAVETGTGTDHITLTDVAIQGFLRIATGSGDDVLDVSEASTAGRVSIDTGKGNDTIHLAPGTLGGKFHLSTRSGNDEVDVTGGTFAAKAAFDGGPGTDGFAATGGGFMQPPELTGFEH